MLERAEEKYARLCEDRTVKDRVYAEIVEDDASEDEEEIYITIRACKDDATLFHYFYRPSTNRLLVDGACFLASDPTEEGELRRDMKIGEQTKCVYSSGHAGRYPKSTGKTSG